MPEPNLFTMLSAYRPGSPATPFENYCTSGLAYFLKRGQRMLTALFDQATGAAGEPIAMVEVQPELAGAGIADLVITYEGGLRAIVEVQVESAADERLMPALQAASATWKPAGVPVLVGLAPSGDARWPWRAIHWLDIVEALDDDPDLLAREFVEFILRDVLGLGPVPLEEALTTNRLYALGAAAIRRAFGEQVRYQNTASPPLRGRYRYLGTSFAVDGGDMACWLGIVNETVPLGEHYQLMLATKATPLHGPAAQPRATGDWKWPYWTGAGRVVRPVAPETLDDLLKRMHS